MINAIITADWHLRSQKPRCRLDENWLETQQNALEQIINHAKEHDADVIVIGDIFHSTNETTNEIIGMVQWFAQRLRAFDKSLYILAGNHDLPQHNLDNIHRAAISLLFKSRNIYRLQNYLASLDGDHVSASDFGAEDNPNARFVFKHILCFPENERMPPEAKAVKPSELFGLFPNASCIFTGDYHRHFVARSGIKRLFNPGCLLRQAADMKDYQPSVIHFRHNEDKVSYQFQRLLITDNEELVTDEYLEREGERAERIQAFIEKVKANGEITFDFLENVKNRLDENKFDDGVKMAILELLED